MSDPAPYSCVVVDDDDVARLIIEQFVEDTPGLTLRASFDSAAKAVSDPALGEARVLFLDVEMPTMSGLEMLGTLSEPPMVILVTSNPDYAVQAFDVDVIDYLLKPVTYARFLKAVNRCRMAMGSGVAPEDTPEHVFVKSDGRLIKLPLVDIEWIEAQRDYVLIHTPVKELFFHSTMKRLSDRLGDADFVRVHRSYIVRLDKIENIEDGSIVIGKKVIPVGESFRDNLLGRLNLL